MNHPHIELAGESLQLLPQRAIWWNRTSTLIISDLHLGKAAAFRHSGIPVPEAMTDADLARLTRLIQRTRAERLIILGDLIHARQGRCDAVIDSVSRWRNANAALSVTLIRGNHDDRAGDPPSEWNITCESGPFTDAPFIYRHDPLDDPRGYVLCGHIHPAVRLFGNGGAAMRAHCFWIGPRCTVLPAFGSFTGAKVIRPGAHDRIFALNADEVNEVRLVQA